VGKALIYIYINTCTPAFPSLYPIPNHGITKFPSLNPSPNQGGTFSTFSSHPNPHPNPHLLPPSLIWGRGAGGVGNNSLIREGGKGDVFQIFSTFAANPLLCKKRKTKPSF